MRRRLFSVALFAACGVLAAADAKSDHPTGNRTTPPTLNSVLPVGIARGTTVEMTVEGLNLAKASAIYFEEPGIRGHILRIKELPDLPENRLGSNGTPSTIDLGPLPPRNQVTIEVEVDAEAEIGPVGFRLLTPLGTSPQGKVLVEPYYGESPDKEPNDTPEGAFECSLPTILAGTIQKPGDVDYYKIQARAGETLSFLNGAAQIGSSLQAVVGIYDADNKLLHEYGTRGGTEEVMFAHTFKNAGTYYVRVSDFQNSGRGGHYYRILVGDFPLTLSAYPLGMRRGTEKSVALTGANLKAAPVIAKASTSEEMFEFRPKRSFTPVRLAAGADPEVESTSSAVGNPQRVTLPVTINGKITAGEHHFRFAAKKGEHIFLETTARRLGSDLDSYVEVLDSAGKPIERAIARSVVESSIALRDHDSQKRGLRISTWSGFAVGDYLMVGNEIVQIAALPRTPDDDMVCESFGGQRFAYFGTSGEAHALDQAIYKVQIYSPGTKLSPNGLPLVHLTYRNDDGGPMFGKDSYLEFVAPADGEYIARIGDATGEHGDAYAYRFSIRQPRADFRLAVSPRNPAVPAGGSIPVTVTAFRMDGFDGPIEVSALNLPASVHVTKGVIAPGQATTTLLLSADRDAKLADAVRFEVLAKAGNIEHAANPDDRMQLLALMPKADLAVETLTREVTLTPGGTGEIQVKIARQNGFGGRVPLEVRNLPERVRVLNVGLNGVLLNEDESERTFTLEALPNAAESEQLVWISGAVETRSGLQTSYAAPQPVLVRVKVRPAGGGKE
ncbi:MAG: hypothetical protein ABI823_00195 [Bryobacteraceae bacterium]